MVSPLEPLSLLSKLLQLSVIAAVPKIQFRYKIYMPLWDCITLEGKRVDGIMCECSSYTKNIPSWRQDGSSTLSIILQWHSDAPVPSAYHSFLSRTHSQ